MSETSTPASPCVVCGRAALPGQHHCSEECRHVSQWRTQNLLTAVMESHQGTRRQKGRHRRAVRSSR